MVEKVISQNEIEQKNPSSFSVSIDLHERNEVTKLYSHTSTLEKQPTSESNYSKSPLKVKFNLIYNKFVIVLIYNFFFLDTNNF